jgi:integrase
MVTSNQSRLHEIVISAHNIAETTKSRYLRDLDQWIAFAGANPINWTRKAAAVFYDELLKRMKPQSANRLMKSVGYASRWFAHYENNDDLDFARVATAKAKDRKPQLALDEASARALLDTCDRSYAGIRDFALIVVGLETGMRCMSLLGMQRGLVNALGSWPYPAAFVPLKGRDPDWVPLSDISLVALNQWLLVLDRYQRLTGPVFCSLQRAIGSTPFRPTDKELSMSGVAKIFSERSKLAGLRHINPHLLRHTFVTWREAMGQKPQEIAAITHHSLGKLGALGGYMDAREIGGRVRNSTPPWLADLVHRRMSDR